MYFFTQVHIISFWARYYAFCEVKLMVISGEFKAG
jgi:hypothetical protein